MRALGLDWGERRIGVALSDVLGLTAQRLTVIERQSMVHDLDVICDLIERHAVNVVVVGLPLTLRGESGVQAQRASGFVEALKRRTSVPVQLVDERLTTAQGERMLRETGAKRDKRKALIDQVAAQLILQHYLDMQAQMRPET